MVNEAQALLAELPPPIRAAIAYAPATARPFWTGLLSLDRRLERAALAPREPIVAQIKLAWWREGFASPAAQWPGGEPLLEMLAIWDKERAALESLVDGWEGLVGGEPGEGELAGLVAARGNALSALARLLDCAPQTAQVAAIGRAWARDDLAGRLSMGAPALSPIPADAGGGKLPRPLRPLTLLADLARPGPVGAVRLARMLRLGLLGR